jgi:hypothetical protein
MARPQLRGFVKAYDLKKVEVEKHLLLVCPSTQKVKEHFCSALLLISTLAELMQTTNTIYRLNQVCGMLPVPKDNLSSMIYLE